MNGNGRDESKFWERNPFNGKWPDEEGYLDDDRGDYGFDGLDRNAQLGIQDRKFATFQGRDFVLEADGIWRDERGAMLTWNINHPIISEITNTRHRVTARNLYGVPSREPDWFLHEWWVKGQCNGLYGVPGVRKSLLMLQAQIAGSIGAEFLGLPLAPSVTLGYYCEDPETVIHRRAEKILRNGYAGRDFDAPGMENCHWHSFVGAIHTEFMTFTRSGTPRFSPEWRWFIEEANDLKPALIGFDVGPHFFGGNEIVRREVHTFIRCVDSVLLPINAAGLLSFHPSMTGIANGNLTSGSTGWEGGVRSRGGMYDPTHDQEPDPNEAKAKMLAFSHQRNLIRFKSNYAKEGEEIPLEIIDNAYFVAAGQQREAFQRGSQLWRLALDSKLMELFDKATATGKTLVDSLQSGNNLGQYLATMDGAKPFKKADFNKRADQLLYTDPPRLRLEKITDTVNRYLRA